MAKKIKNKDIENEIEIENIPEKESFEKESKKDTSSVSIRVLKPFWLSGVFYGVDSILEVTQEKASLLLSKPQAFEPA